MDVAERLTGGLLNLERKEEELSDRGTVVRWLREMHLDHHTQILVHRPWGTIVAVADRGRISGGVLARRSPRRCAPTRTPRWRCAGWLELQPRTC